MKKVQGFSNHWSCLLPTEDWGTEKILEMFRNRHLADALVSALRVISGARKAKDLKEEI